MNTKNEITEETIKVSSDMLIDILAIILKEGLTYEIVQVLENRALVLIVISIDSNQSRQVKVIQNIRSLLNNYNEYRYSQEESFNWRES